jgi:ATP phosphoribosyltransferase
LITELVSALPIRDNPTFVRYLPTEEMIDPVTALHVLDKAASLAGALSQVFKAVYDYARSVKDAPEHSRQLQDELYNLSNIARRLEITLAKESIPRVKSNVAEDSIVRFVEILKEMERKVAIPEGKMSIKRLRWPFTLKENMEYLEKIERFKATLILASNVHQRYHSLLRQ